MSWATRSGVLVAVLGLAFAFTASSGRAAPEGLTRKELGLLRSGELVVRPSETRERGARYIGGASWQIIDAPPRVVWDAILDTQYYPRMMPQVHEARVVKNGRKQRVVYIRHVTGPIDTSYYLLLDLDESRREVRFKLDKSRPHDLSAAYGIYVVRPYGGNRSLLAYTIKADIGGGLLTLLVEPLVHEWMLKVPMTVKRFVEGSGRWIYGLETAAR